MANTVIQLKFSTVTATPTSLNVAEPAYSYSSNTLFIGSPAGTGSIAIGGQFFIDKFQRGFDTANAAFLAANTAGSSAFVQAAFNTANASFNHANAGFQAANSAGSYANSAFAAANAANATDTTQNNSITAAFTAANSAGVYANSAFAAANAASATDTTQNNSITAAFTAANSAGVYANSAFDKANTDVTGISITAADHGSASAVASFKVEANGRISSANSTTIAIAASAITSGTLGVARGGTGAGTFTTNGVLLGQGTGAFTTASSSTEGHVLTINDSGVPTFSHLQGGTF